MQILIKDGRGKTLQSLDRITNYAKVASDMRSINATLPLQVWSHDAVTGISAYDSKRTQALSRSMRAAQS